MSDGKAIDRLVEELLTKADAITQFLKMLQLLQKSGLLQLIVGFLERFDENMTFLVESNSNLVRVVNEAYAIFNGKEEIGDVTFTDILRMLNDKDVRRGVYLMLKLLKVIGSANKGG
ncbi:MAG: DUF1641 domain-containing protein [Sulfolobaceae archaeon]|jgi:uncharacterized protein YjgD (DUF1641 family)|nr:DUF1641 domain-containing protein [Sulfolobaceae archaeon]